MPQPLILLLNNLSVLTVLDQTQPPASVLMVHNHQSQSFDATAPGVTTAEHNLSAADGTGPDPTTGLCADGSQPQPQSQSFNATAADLATQQLVCADGPGPDPTTGLCADGSQPQSQALNATAAELLLLLTTTCLC